MFQIIELSQTFFLSLKRAGAIFIRDQAQLRAKNQLETRVGLKLDPE